MDTTDEDTETVALTAEIVEVPAGQASPYSQPDWPDNLPKEVFLLPVDEAPSFAQASSDFLLSALSRASWWLHQTDDLLVVYGALKVLAGYRKALGRDSKKTRVDIAELERRFENRAGVLILLGQEQGIFNGHNHDVGMRLIDYLECSRAVVYFLQQMGKIPQKELDQIIARGRDEGTLGQDNVLRMAKGEDLPKPDRSIYNHGRRRTDSNRIIRVFADQLEAAVSGIELVVPEDLDPQALQEVEKSVFDTILNIGKEMSKWQQQQQ